MSRPHWCQYRTIVLRQIADKLWCLWMWWCYIPPPLLALLDTKCYSSNWLFCSIGISGVAWQRFIFYFTDRQQFIRVQSETLTSIVLARGSFSSRSVVLLNLRRTNFTSLSIKCSNHATRMLMTQNLSSLWKQAGAICTMLWISLRICLLRVREWMDANFLKPNCNDKPKY